MERSDINIRSFLCSFLKVIPGLLRFKYADIYK